MSGSFPITSIRSTKEKESPKKFIDSITTPISTIVSDIPKKKSEKVVSSNLASTSNVPNSDENNLSSISKTIVNSEKESESDQSMDVLKTEISISQSKLIEDIELDEKLNNEEINKKEPEQKSSITMVLGDDKKTKTMDRVNNSPLKKPSTEPVNSMPPINITTTKPPSKGNINAFMNPINKKIPTNSQNDESVSKSSQSTTPTSDNIDSPNETKLAPLFTQKPSVQSFIKILHYYEKNPKNSTDESMDELNSLLKIFSDDENSNKSKENTLPCQILDLEMRRLREEANSMVLAELSSWSKFNGKDPKLNFTSEGLAILYDALLTEAMKLLINTIEYNPTKKNIIDSSSVEKVAQIRSLLPQIETQELDLGIAFTNTITKADKEKARLKAIKTTKKHYSELKSDETSNNTKKKRSSTDDE
jgi:hypothetical protein